MMSYICYGIGHVLFRSVRYGGASAASILSPYAEESVGAGADATGAPRANSAELNRVHDTDRAFQ